MSLTRKQFLGMTGAASLSGAGREAQAPSSGGDSGPSSQKPNILILLSDQHRPDLLTSAGNDLVPTPNIDRIASRGVRFSNAYCPYPVCSPSRMSLLTGLHAHHHHVIGNTAMDRRIRTVAHHFHDHGYMTGLIGKMHFTDGQTHGFDYRLGFNDWLMYLGPKVRHYINEIASPPNLPVYERYFRTVDDTGSGFPAVRNLWSGENPWVGRVKRKDTLASELEAEDHVDTFVAREASKFIQRYKDEPFFLIAGFLKPHAPFFPPKGWADELYPPEKMSLRPVGKISKYPRHIRERISWYQADGEEVLRFRRAGYLGNLAFVDNCIGQVYKTLEELDLLDKTIVIYTSDHGEMDGEHGLYQKFVFFEPSVRVPLIVSWPKLLPQGEVSDALVEYFGIYPTLTELTQTGSPEGIDASSFMPLLQNPGSPGPAAAFAEFALESAPRYMIRTRRFKYVYNETDIDELYDLESDPGELFNQADDPGLKEVRRRHHEQLLAWFDPDKNPFRKRREGG